MVGNGATNWEVDISPSFPDVMYNFNLIPKSLLDTYKNNDCVNYFNDLKPPSNSTVCVDAWNQINDLWDGLNWYDLFRKVVPDSGLLKQSASDEDRMRTVEVGGENKTYKAGYTFQEYAPWISKHIPKQLLKESSHPLLGDYLADYANRPDVRRALNIPDHVQAWLECNDSINGNYSYQYEGSFWIYKILK
jgi:Serine carboxypeptidase